MSQSRITVQISFRHAHDAPADRDAFFIKERSVALKALENGSEVGGRFMSDPDRYDFIFSTTANPNAIAQALNNAFATAGLRMEPTARKDVAAPDMPSGTIPSFIIQRL